MTSKVGRPSAAAPWAQPASRLDAIAPSPIRAIFDKAAELEAAGRKVFHFEIGRPDFDSPSVAIDATIASLRRGEVHYGPNLGSRELRDGIAEYLERRRGVRYDPADEVLVTIGANEAVFLALMAFCGPGDEVLVPTPSWANYQSCIRLTGATPVPVALRADDDYRFDAAAIRNAITPKTRMVIVCTPNNPTGGVVSRDELVKLGDALEESNALLLSDEIYADLIYGDVVHTSPAALNTLKERTISIGGFAKSFAMDGWRLGWLAAPRQLVKPALRVRQFTTVCPPTFQQPGAAAALRDASEDAETMRLEFERRRDAGLEILSGIPGLQVTSPEGAFYLYLTYDARLAEPAEDLALRVLEDEGVAVVPGTAFDPVGGSHSLRISYACHIDDLRTGLTRLARVLSHADSERND